MEIRILSIEKFKGDEIFIGLPVNDSDETLGDRRWAGRLEWVIREHLDRVGDDPDKLQSDYEAVLRKPREVHERKYDQAYISDLTMRLDAANKNPR
jgi:hypothetical protein